jgi:radical SAM protein with 4Fe4S-binding SPASM domain
MLSTLDDIRFKLAKHGAARASLRSLANTALNETERRLGRSTLLSNPDIVHIEPTTACNLGCKMCGRSTFWKDLVDNSAHMQRETFLALVPFLKTARLAVLHGWGEPLLHPDLVWMVEICKDNGCMVSFHTNGLLLTDETSQELIDAGLDALTISIDGATPETYKAVRGAPLDVLIGNLQRLRKRKQAAGSVHPRIGFKSVLMRQNLDELPALVALAKACGADEIELNNLIVYNDALADQSIFDRKEEVQAAFESARDLAAQDDIRLFYGGVEEADGVPACPFRSFTVTCDGTVGPCGAQRFAMGNIHDSSLRELWNDPNFVGMREAYGRKDLPHQCEHCPSRTNKEEDHTQPDLTYVEETLEARQWANADSRLNLLSPSPVEVTPAAPPPCDAPDATSGCSSTPNRGCS